MGRSSCDAGSFFHVHSEIKISRERAWLHHDYAVEVDTASGFGF